MTAGHLSRFGIEQFPQICGSKRNSRCLRHASIVIDQPAETAVSPDRATNYDIGIAAGSWRAEVAAAVRRLLVVVGHV